MRRNLGRNLRPSQVFLPISYPCQVALPTDTIRGTRAPIKRKEVIGS